MNKYSYCVNTFKGSEPVQLCGTIEAAGEYDAIQALIDKGGIDQSGYEFIEFNLITKVEV